VAILAVAILAVAILAVAILVVAIPAVVILAVPEPALKARIRSAVASLIGRLRVHE